MMTTGRVNASPGSRSLPSSSARRCSCWSACLLVILMFGAGSPVVRVVPDEGLRRLITGFLFGTTGALIALSPVGKESGAHINPVVTLGFWLMGKLDSRIALSYVFAQLAGATCGRPAAPWLGCDGPERGFRRDAARRRLRPSGRLDG